MATKIIMEKSVRKEEEGCCFFDDDDQEEDCNSNEEEYHSNEEDYASDEEEYHPDQEEDYASDDGCTDENVTEFTILNSQDIRRRLEENIVEISTLLSVTREAAIILLCKYRWDVSRIHEEWFTDEEKVRKFCGLIISENPSYTKGNIGDGKLFFCGICLEDHDNHHAVMADCGHVFCQTCWKTYIYIAIKDGPGCLFLRCPQPSCGAIIGEDMIDLLASDEDRLKYDNYVFRSYIEDRKNIKWCPSPGCEFAVECLGNPSEGNFNNFDVTCHCSYGFCWKCSEEAHSPADCETAAKWILKNSCESENTNWILTNTKQCPKCRRTIEKNQGCMHMTCRYPCNFEFCWLCLGPWMGHGESYERCNSYEAAKRSGDYDESERIREMAKKSLEKYTHYYERWAANNKSCKKALSDMKILQAEHLKKLSEIQSLTRTQMEFIIDAWVQIVECRRVLKWTYAYGYFLPEDDPARKKFFEYLQGEAEAGLERLHHCAEKELFVHIEPEVSLEEFKSFSAKLVDLTKVTRTYFDNLVRALENGLSDVN